MMVPIAACISQLKWTEFRQPTRLSLLQSIDDASLGVSGPPSQGAHQGPPSPSSRLPDSCLGGV
ncbi:hypothetical protein CH063_06928 [Colletotrichum higginsianum]|nr:hypothetical protein CH063_06928 [Colletotrichum higginsianum]